MVAYLSKWACDMLDNISIQFRLLCGFRAQFIGITYRNCNH